MLDPENFEMENFNLPLKEKSIHLFTVPENYFNNFSNEITEIIQLMELEDPVFISNKEIYYSIPDNYFTNFPSKILSFIQSEESHRHLFLNSLTKTIPYTIPENYFENFEEELFTHLEFYKNDFKEEDASSEISALSPLLAKLKEKETYEMPSGYLDSPKKVVEFKPRKAEQSIQWMRWAAAAMVIALFSFGGWQFLNTPEINQGAQFANISEELSTIPDEAIAEYLKNTLNDYELTLLAQNGDAGTKVNTNPIFDDISNSEIENYLETISY